MNARQNVAHVSSAIRLDLSGGKDHHRSGRNPAVNREGSGPLTKAGARSGTTAIISLAFILPGLALMSPALASSAGSAATARSSAAASQGSAPADGPCSP